MKPAAGIRIWRVCPSQVEGGLLSISPVYISPRLRGLNGAISPVPHKLVMQIFILQKS